MKNNLIISIIVLAIAGILATGCTNKEAKAQALLIEAISYSDGKPSAAGWEPPLKIAADHGYKPASGYEGLSDGEVVMVAGRLLCDQILTQYPTTQTAIKAAELKNQINQRLREIANERIHMLFNNN